MKPPSISTNLKKTPEIQHQEVDLISNNLKKLNSHLERQVESFSKLSNVEISWLSRFSTLEPKQILSILTQEFVTIDSNSHNFPTTAALDNVDKNRYRDILPWDYNRVKLYSDSQSQNSLKLYSDQEYINASFMVPNPSIEFSKSNSKIISTQGPLPNTILDFWTLVYNQNIRVIYNLTREEEGGRLKCAKYWPNVNEFLEYSDLRVKCSSMEETLNFRIYILEISRGLEIRDLRFYHFTEWPDHSGSDPRKVLGLLKTFNHGLRNLVHCSAGVGRTGTFISLATILSGIEKSQESQVFRIVSRLREQRVYSVQSLEQYIFIYKVILFFINEKYKF